MTEDREVIDIDRHRSELQDCHEQHLDYIETVVDANAKLASELRATQRSVDEAQVKAVATDVVSAFDEEVDISGEQLTQILIDGFSEEVERRVEQECQHRVRRAKQDGLAMAASRGVVAMRLDSSEDTGGQG